MSEIADRDQRELALCMQTLLLGASIGRMIIVDDMYAPTDINREELIAHVQSSPEDYQELLPELNELDPGQLDRIAAVVESAMSDPDKLKELTLFYRQSSSGIESEKALHVLDSLVELMSEDHKIELHKFSGTEWEKQSAEILTKDSKGSLVLVDKDFTAERLGEDHGFNIVRKVANQTYTQNISCALMSHTVPPSEELMRWEGWSADKAIQRDKFVVISKRRLAGENAEEADLAGFVHLVRLAILSEPFCKMRSLISDSLINAIKSAANKLNEWNVFDFEQAIFSSSRDEGVWEGDTLVRVLTTAASQEAHQSILSNPELRQSVNMARAASGLQKLNERPQSWSGAGKRALAYQSTEIYRESPYLNGHHLPIELGDIFEHSQTREQYILLAQPCELMVRSDGLRSRDDRYSRMVPLCRLREAGSGDPEQCHQLKFWGETGSSRFIHFNDFHMVRCMFLDLCVFDPGGRSVMHLDAKVADGLSHSWTARFSKLQLFLKTEQAQVLPLLTHIGGRFCQIAKDFKDLARSRVLPYCSNTGTFQSSLTETELSADLRRIRRLVPVHAADALRRFSSNQARQAFEGPIVAGQSH